VAAAAAERRGLEEKIAALNLRISEDESSAGVKLDAALRREAERYGEIIERKNKELDAAAHLRQSEEDAYRKSLADFRSSLSEALGKMETLKGLADERQAQVLALQVELSQEKKQAGDQTSSLSSRLSDKEKLYRDLMLQHEDLKETFEEEVKVGERRYNDALLKLRAAEEQRAGRDKQIEALKRDLELLRADNLRRDHEASELKSSVSKQVESERREMHASGERRAHEYAQKEKALLAEISSLRDMVNAKDIQLEKQKVQSDEARSSAERLRGVLEEERVRYVENEAALRAVKDDYDSRLAAMAEREKALSAELISLKRSLSASAGDALESRGEAENLRSGLERLKAAFEEEKKKRAEAEAAALTAGTALREKSADAEARRADVEALKNGIERLKAAFTDERKKRSDAELMAESATMALREKGDQLSSQKADLDGTRNAADRLKAALEEEKRRRAEAEAAAEAARHALAAKSDESGSRRSEIEALRHAIERLKSAFEDERSKRVESELLAQTAHSALREKQEEFLRTQKLVEQLKDKLRLWKSK